MYEETLRHSRFYTDIKISQVGYEQCRPAQSWGPGSRDAYILHCISRGQGTLRHQGRCHFLKKGDCFVIFPHTKVHYAADEDQPWEYSWVMWNGLLGGHVLEQAGIHRMQPAFTCETKQIRLCIERMCTSWTMEKGRDSYLLGQFFLMISAITQALGGRKSESIEEKSRLIQAAADYIEVNYPNPVKISDMARWLGVSPDYLGALFRETFNKSTKSYLIEFRMQKAKELIQNQDLSIGDIARSVGYEDPLLFSKMFKDRVGISPRAYRGRVRLSQNRQKILKEK